MHAFGCALALSACRGSSSDSVELAKVDVGPQPGAGFSALTRAELAKAGGPPLDAKAAAAAAAAAHPADAPAAGGKPVAGASAPTGGTATAAPAPAPQAKAAPSGGQPTAAPQPTEVQPAGAQPAAQPAGAQPATAPQPAGAQSAAGQPVPVELSAVKLTLPEGWVRDQVAPGTFSFVVPGEGGKNVRFLFRYAYEDATAPLEREAYKEWLGHKKLMKVNVDRQRGAAWFLEGIEPSGEAGFRYVITYGGRLLSCGGSLYKQGAAAGLRDVRDEIVLQAKRICESLNF